MAKNIKNLGDAFIMGSDVNITFQDIEKENIIIPNWKVKSRSSEIGFNNFQPELMGPIIVCNSSADGAFVLIDGYRRLQAIKSTSIPCCVMNFTNSDDARRIAPILSLLCNCKEPYSNYELEQILEDGQFTALNLPDNVFDSLFNYDTGMVSAVREVLNVSDSDSKPLVKLRDSFRNGKVEISQVAAKLKAAKKKIEKVAAFDGSKDCTNELRKKELYQDPDNRTRVPAALKKAVLVRDNNTCQCCGLTGPQWSSALVFHHKVPVALGGADTMDNGITLCVNCHLSVHTYQVGELFIPEGLTGKDKETMDKIVELGNIAVRAAKEQDLDIAEVKKLTASEGRHPYPTENLGVNRDALKLAATLGVSGNLADEVILEAAKEDEAN